VNIVHIQWEFSFFGSFYATLLLPLFLLLLSIFKIKRVITIHSVVPRFSFGLNLSGFTIPKFMKVFVESIFIFLYKMIAALSDAIIVHGKSLRKLLCLDYKIKEKKVFISPYGVASQVKPSKVLAKFHEFSPKNEVILALGTLSPRKGLGVLINAFKKLALKHSSWTLVIAGGVPPYYEYYYRHLKELASSLIKQKRVIFVGEFRITDVHRLLETSKVVVFPYIYNFGASSTVTFALQHQKIVVISDLSFATDLFTDGENATLVAVPAGEKESLMPG